MNVPVIAFFNNKAGVGKTSLVYHLSWMYSDIGVNVISADLDPQANLTAAFLDEDRLEDLWNDGNLPNTVYRSVEPLVRGVGDVVAPMIEDISDRLGLLVGDLSLSGFEEQLSDVWPRCADGEERAFRVTSAFWRVIQMGAAARGARLILLDLGPNLGAINRAALLAADFVVVPLSPDRYSLQGLKNLGPTLRRWRSGWKDRLTRRPSGDLALPAGTMTPAGYIVLQHAIRLDRPVRAYDKWIAQIPAVYRCDVLDQPADSIVRLQDDPNCLALLKHYRSLMPLAQEARKPMFFLKPADGAIGGHANAAKSAYMDFALLARKVAERTSVNLDDSLALQL